MKETEKVYPGCEGDKCAVGGEGGGRVQPEMGGGEEEE